MDADERGSDLNKFRWVFIRVIRGKMISSAAKWLSSVIK